MSLETSQKPANGVEPPQEPPATSATPAVAVNASKNDSAEVPNSLSNDTKDVKDPSGSAAKDEVATGQPLEAAKPKEPIEPTKPFQPEAPLPKGNSDSASADMKNNGVSTAQNTSSVKEAKSSEKMDVDTSTNNLPASDPTTLGDVPAKDSAGQDVDQTKVQELSKVQENAKHGHDDDQAAVEEQPPAKKQKTEPVKESNGADTPEAPKRSMSKKKKEPKKATTENGQPRRSSRLAS